MKSRMLSLVLLAWAAVAEGADYVEPQRAMSVGGGFGWLEATVDPSLSGHDPGGSFYLNFAYRFRPRFAMAFDIEMHGQDYDTPDFVQAPFFGTVDDEVKISTASMTLQGIYSVSLWRTRLHLGAGAGLYRTRLVLDGSVLGVPGRVADETDSDLGTHLLARWDMRLTGNWWVGAEYRRIDASADFGRWTGGEIDVGGVVRYLTLRRQFDATPWSPPQRSQP